MATSQIAVTQGSGKNLATYSISEDAVTREVSRVTLNSSDGLLLTALPSADVTNAIYNSTTAITPAFASIAASSMGGDTGNLVVALSSQKKVRVLAANLIAAGTVDVKWQTVASTNADVTGLAYLVANAGYVLPYNPVGWFQTLSSEALHLNLSASVAVGGHLTYILV